MALLEATVVPQLPNSSGLMSRGISMLSQRKRLGHRSVRKQAPDATDNTSLEISGVALNGRGDLSLFLNGIVINVVTLVVYACGFAIARTWFPAICSYGFISGRVKEEVKNDWTSWVSSSLNLEFKDHLCYCGLDHAMLLEYCNLSMRLCAYIGIPMVVCMSPLYFLFGHGTAEENGDNLSLIAMGNVAFGHPWLYYVNGIVTLLVCWITKHEVFKIMEFFCEKRTEWLENLPPPQATNIMVEGIPEVYQSEDKLWEYFTKFFPKDDIKDIHIVNHIPELEAEVAAHEAAELALTKAHAEWKQTGKRPKTAFYQEDALRCYEEQKSKSEENAGKYRDQLEQKMKTVGGVNGDAAFVTFDNALDCSKAIGLNFSHHRDEGM